MTEHRPQSNNPDRPDGVAPSCPDADHPWLESVDRRGALTGRDLRYVLTDYISQGYRTVAALVRKLGEDGFTVWGRASKVVSDALRWEIRNGRIRRVARGTYVLREIPRTTAHRIRHRAMDLFRAPEVVAIRRNNSDVDGSRPTPSPDRNWREWRKGSHRAGGNRPPGR